MKAIIKEGKLSVKESFSEKPEKAES